MSFSEDLKKAMYKMNINATQLAGLINKSKGSVSGYLRDYVIPPEAEQRKIAEALGLQPDYFEEGDLACYLGKRAKKLAVQRLNVKTAAELLKMSQMTLQRGLQQGVFPWGYAIKSKDKETYSYFINAKRFVEIEGIEVNA